MEIKLKLDINNDRMSDGLQAAIDAINQINGSAAEAIKLDFSEVGFITPLYVLPLVVFLNGCNKSIEIVGTNDYLQTIGFASGMHLIK